MAVGVLIELEGVSDGEYDKIQSVVARKPANGLILHTAGQVNQHLQVFDIWQDTGAFDRFVQHQLRPAMEQVGLAHVRPKITFCDLHNVWTADAVRLGKIGAHPMPAGVA